MDQTMENRLRLQPARLRLSPCITYKYYYTYKNSGISLKMCLKRNTSAFPNKMHYNSDHHESATFVPNPKAELAEFSQKATPCP